MLAPQCPEVLPPALCCLTSRAHLERQQCEQLDQEAGDTDRGLAPSLHWVRRTRHFGSPCLNFHFCEIGGITLPEQPNPQSYRGFIEIKYFSKHQKLTSNYVPGLYSGPEKTEMSNTDLCSGGWSVRAYSTVR